MSDAPPPPSTIPQTISATNASPKPFDKRPKSPPRMRMIHYTSGVLLEADAGNLASLRKDPPARKMAHQTSGFTSKPSSTVKPLPSANAAQSSDGKKP